MQIMSCTCYVCFARSLHVRRWCHLTRCKVNTCTIQFVNTSHNNIIWRECHHCMWFTANKWRCIFNTQMWHSWNVPHQKNICDARKLYYLSHAKTMNLTKINRLLLKMFVQTIIFYKVRYTQRRYSKFCSWCFSAVVTAHSVHCNYFSLSQWHALLIYFMVFVCVCQAENCLRDVNGKRFMPW